MTDGYTILQLSDLHVDMNRDAMTSLGTISGELDYDVRALTGDYRGPTYGPYEILKGAPPLAESGFYIP